MLPFTNVSSPKCVIIYHYSSCLSQSLNKITHSKLSVLASESSFGMFVKSLRMTSALYLNIRQSTRTSMATVYKKDGNRFFKKHKMRGECETNSFKFKIVDGIAARVCGLGQANHNCLPTCLGKRFVGRLLLR